MTKLHHLARMTTPTTGTGTITLGPTVAGYLSFANAGIRDGDGISYTLVDGSQTEIGRGVYRSTGPTLSRMVLQSSNDNNPLNLSGGAEVYVSEVLGGGDMLKAIYDTNGNGIVDAAESVPWAGVTGKPAISPFGVYCDFLALPGLRGFWPMSAMTREGPDGGRAIDVSGQGRHLDMRLGTYANFGITGNLAPIATLSEGYLIRANEAGLNGFGALGRISEGYLGMTVGGWFRIHAADRPEQVLISKWTDGSETWMLDIYSTNSMTFWLKPPSVGPIDVSISVGVGVNVWIFGVARWTRGTEIAMFQNGTKATNTIGVPTELPSTTSPLVIGATDSGANRKFFGDVSLCFLCDFALPDSVINRLYQNSRHLFGV